jgi:hypothetical protein
MQKKTSETTFKNFIILYDQWCSLLKECVAFSQEDFLKIEKNNKVKHQFFD